MGVADWNCMTCIGWNVTRDWMHTAKPWTTSASHDRGYWNRQQPPHFSSPLYKDEPLTPTMLLMMNTCPLAPHLGNLDLYAYNWWKRAQYLADQFWVRCKREYLQNFQNRSKWRSGGTLMAKCWWPKWLHVEQETQIPTKNQFPVSSFNWNGKRKPDLRTMQFDSMDLIDITMTKARIFNTWARSDMNLDDVLHWLYIIFCLISWYFTSFDILSLLWQSTKGEKRWGLGPRNNVFTTCKAVTFRGGQRIIAVYLTSRGNKSTIKKIMSCLFVFLAYCICLLVSRLPNASDTQCNSVNS